MLYLDVRREFIPSASAIHLFYLTPYGRTQPRLRQRISENLYEKASSLLQMKNEILKGTQALLLLSTATENAGTRWKAIKV